MPPLVYYCNDKYTFVKLRIINLMLNGLILGSEGVGRQRLWDQIAVFAKRGFVAHRNHRGVDDEKDNEEPRREDRQGHQARDTEALFFRREDQDRSGWLAWRGQHC